MKRLAMDFEPAPVDGMPSFLDMVAKQPRRLNNMMPRWWLAPNYEPLRRDDDGLAWELRGQGVKCMTEQDFLDDAGPEAALGQGRSDGARSGPTRSPRSSTSSPAKIRASASFAT